MDVAAVSTCMGASDADQAHPLMEARAGAVGGRCSASLRAAGGACRPAARSLPPLLPAMQAQLAAQVDAEASGRGRIILLPTVRRSCARAPAPAPLRVLLLLSCGRQRPAHQTLPPPLLSAAAPPTHPCRAPSFQPPPHPQVVINSDQYRGSLAAPAVLRALCSGFSEGRWVRGRWAGCRAGQGEADGGGRRAGQADAGLPCGVLSSGPRLREERWPGSARRPPSCPAPAAPARSEPPICLTGALNVDDCAAGADACWRGADAAGRKLSACVDTFRGYVCRCPAGGLGLIPAGRRLAGGAGAVASGSCPACCRRLARQQRRPLHAPPRRPRQAGRATGGAARTLTSARCTSTVRRAAPLGARATSR